MKKKMMYKENHCDYCKEVFCCINCRYKHEHHVHQKTMTDSLRIALSAAPNVTRRRPKFPEITRPVKFNSPFSKRSRISMVIRKETSMVQMTDKRNCDKSGEIKVNQNSKNDTLTNDKTPNFEDTKENIPPNQIKSNTSTAGHTPPRLTTENDEQNDKQSSQDENSSIYTVCSENLTKSGMNPTDTDVCDSSTNENRGKSENSSVYFACSESLTRKSTDNYSKPNGDSEGFETFELNSKLASTKFEMTFAQESLEVSSFVIDSSISTEGEYMTPCVREFNDKTEIVSVHGGTQTDNSTETTISANGTQSCSINFDECSSIKMEEVFQPIAPPDGFLSEYAQACATQTSFYASLSNSNPPLTDKSNVSNTESSIASHVDKTLWQSFSSSLQRAFNSTKQLCNTIGLRNKSKRLLEDIEEQPKPKRPKILCRPPIRVTPRVVFRMEGDTRKPVIAFDKGTQTDFD